MKTKDWLPSSIFTSLAILIMELTSPVEGGMKFSINDHAVQIFRIVEDMAHSTKGVELTMHPSYFNYLVPFTTVVTCTDGTTNISGVEHTHAEESYMEAINETHSYLQVRFAVADLSYRYDSCWLSVGVIPVPIWLGGKVLHSHYFLSLMIRYVPKCRVDIQRAELLSYETLTVNVFQWMPGVIGNWLLDAITRNTQENIFSTVEKSIQMNTEAILESYNPCIAFPSMGRMTPHGPTPGTGKAETKDELLDDSRYIGGLLDEIAVTEGMQQHSGNTPKPDSEIGNIEEKEKIAIFSETEETRTVSETKKTEL